MSHTLSVTTPTVREIVLTRTFDATRDLVFAAFTTPALLTRWYGARGWHLVACEVDLRVGGAWRFESVGPDGARMVQSGVYREITPPERVCFTEVFADQSYPGESLITHRFVERDATTTVTSTVLYPSRAARDTVLRYPMARGVSESYHRLEELLKHPMNGDAS
jgi:uncharacterized protein YndB with AHSA1/START domain